MANLLFCMTPGVGLNTWKKNGTINRELKPYLHYVEEGWNVKIITFDKTAISNLPDGIKAICLPSRGSLWLLPWVYRELGVWADVIKTNQSFHAYHYTRAARSWRKPILLRCGYIHGEYLETMEGFSLKTRVYQALEAEAFQSATHCQVPTEILSLWLQKRYRIAQNKISIVPNFIDTKIFKPIKGTKRVNRSIISIGRLEPVKRFDMLIMACNGIKDCKLTIIGEGAERDRLRNLAKEQNVDLTLLDFMPNERLPLMLNQHQIFVITSAWEGHPKVLFEAMSCGLPCLVTDSIMADNPSKYSENVWVAPRNATSIRKSLCLLMDDKNLRVDLSRKAVSFVEKNCRFEQCFESERKTLDTLRRG